MQPRHLAGVRGEDGAASGAGRSRAGRPRRGRAARRRRRAAADRRRRTVRGRGAPAPSLRESPGPTARALTRARWPTSSRRRVASAGSVRASSGNGRSIASGRPGSSGGRADAGRATVTRAGAGAQRAACGEGRGAGHAARAGDEQHVAEGALVALAGRAGARCGARSPAVVTCRSPATRVSRAGGKADVRQPEAPDVPRRRVARSAPASDNRRSRSPWRGPPRRADAPVVRRETGGEVDREHGAAEAS